MNVVWTDVAQKTHQNNLDYLLQEWPNQVLINYIDELDQVIVRISNNPYLFPIYNRKKKIHKCVLNRNLSLYYQVLKDDVILLLFWNTQQNPKSLKL